MGRCIILSGLAIIPGWPGESRTMKDRLCNLFEPCETPEAPLCPLRQNTVAHGRWYADEQVCKAHRFQQLSWIRNQKRIATLGLTADDGFFTVKMLSSVQAAIMAKRLKGASPDFLISELRWLEQLPRKRAADEHKGRRRKSAPANRSAKSLSSSAPNLWKVTEDDTAC
jgi:hypothetical protein